LPSLRSIRAFLVRGNITAVVRHRTFPTETATTRPDVHVSIRLFPINVVEFPGLHVEALHPRSELSERLRQLPSKDDLKNPNR
jgi:hypothetical protein